MERFAFIHPHFSFFRLMLNAICLLQTIGIIAYSVEHNTLHISLFPRKGIFIKKQNKTKKHLRVLSFTSYVQTSSLKHQGHGKHFILFYQRMNWKSPDSFPWLADWLTAHIFPRSETVCFIFVHLCILWFLYWCKRKKRKKWKVIADPNTTINSQMLHLL